MFAELNSAQAEAVSYRGGHLLVLAGAGTGKTRTLAARVAALVAEGVPPERLLLLTFTRRAAREMLDRAERETGRPLVGRVWGGTFHAVANRLLRRAAPALGLPASFSLLDAGDSADLFDLIRDEAALERGRRFPRGGTLAAIYSRVANSEEPLRAVLVREHPWCAADAGTIAELFREYAARKRAGGVLDYDDLLRYWRALLAAEVDAGGHAVPFEHVLVDEYQDANGLQVDVVRCMAQAGAVVTAVGDDAQAIYGFRAASAHHIRAFADDFAGAVTVRLEQSYRSTQAVLDVANAVLRSSTDALRKQLWSTDQVGPSPRLLRCVDEQAQSWTVCDAALDRRDRGIPLREQAVLFRTGHHSAGLELELARRNIPYVKYGGLRFLEAAHVKDLVAMLRVLDNDADELAWFRVLQLAEGVGPAIARRVIGVVGAGRVSAAAGQALGTFVSGPVPVPDVAVRDIDDLRLALADAAAPGMGVDEQIARLRAFYGPRCARRHGNAEARDADLEQLERQAAGYGTRSAFVTDLTLDPPSSTGQLAGAPLRDEDYLVLSTIHSAKGLEWTAVTVIHAADGCIPSDMATGRPEELEEERRILYVALTRARRELDVCVPLRFYVDRIGRRDRHVYAQASRFLDEGVRAAFTDMSPAGPAPAEDAPGGAGATVPGAPASRVAADQALEALWG